MILYSDQDYPVGDLFREMTTDFLDRASNEGVTEVGDWQALDVSALPQGRTIELRNAVFEYQIPEYREVDQDVNNPWPPVCQNLDDELDANQPWAEAHFQERVSGEPLNPPPSHKLWPWAQHNAEHQDETEAFSHSYPERLWPKHAGTLGDGIDGLEDNKGLRYTLGDLNDAVTLLKNSPGTRQCFIPIWFAEDLHAAAVEHVRVPCSLGYWVVEREGRLHMTYLIRSVDFIRHFPDDVYLACRLCQWLCEKLERDVKPGTLTMWMGSFHVFEGDLPNLRRKLREQQG